MAIIKSINYSVNFGEKSLKALSNFLNKKKYNSLFILCDENTYSHCLPVLILNCPELAKAELIEIESGESSKSLDFCVYIWQSFIEQEADKHTLLINLGGGVISDLGGFVGALYKRGIDFIHLPTSLLAMADASVGGKTGIDFMGFKNNLGSFTQPKAVFIYPPFLTSLPERHVLNGWVEVCKMALIADKKLWAALKSGSFNKNRDAFILRAIELKNKIVLKDPYDQSQRKILNFGHSIGHAIESFFMNEKEDLLHGEAVCLGMLAESHLAWQKKLITKKELHEISTTLQTLFHPKKLQQLNLTSILNALKQDKKNKNGKYRFALVNKIGACKFDVEVNEKQIEEALKFSLS